MSSAGSFRNFIQERDAAGLIVYMTNERYLRSGYLERNNRALFFACREGADEICTVLIRFGADVNSAVCLRRTPLLASCLAAHPACVDLLLSHGAKVNGDFNQGWTPLMATVDEIDVPLGLTLDQLIDNRCQCMRSMLAAGAEINRMADDGRNALMLATWNFQLTKNLLDAGANVNSLIINRDSVLHLACARVSSADVVKLLLEHGAEIDAVDLNGATPLHYACLFLNPGRKQFIAPMIV